MKLKDFLEVCDRNEYVGIWDTTHINKKRKSRKRFELQPTPQNYFKIKNIPYGRIMHLLDKDIRCIEHTPKGYMIQLYTKSRVEQDFERFRLANEIADALKRKEGC